MDSNLYIIDKDSLTNVADCVRKLSNKSGSMLSLSEMTQILSNTYGFLAGYIPFNIAVGSSENVLTVNVNKTPSRISLMYADSDFSSIPSIPAGSTEISITYFWCDLTGKSDENYSLTAGGVMYLSNGGFKATGIAKTTMFIGKEPKTPIVKVDADAIKTDLFKLTIDMSAINGWFRSGNYILYCEYDN